eukprot:COSAG03_NODE_3277_length_2107_cov_347.025398_1_plen_557_part_01
MGAGERGEGGGEGGGGGEHEEARDEDESEEDEGSSSLYETLSGQGDDPADPWWAHTPMPQKDAPVKRGKPRVWDSATLRSADVRVERRTGIASIRDRSESCPRFTPYVGVLVCSCVASKSTANDACSLQLLRCRTRAAPRRRAGPPGAEPQTARHETEKTPAARAQAPASRWSGACTGTFRAERVNITSPPSASPVWSSASSASECSQDARPTVTEQHEFLDHAKAKNWSAVRAMLIKNYMLINATPGGPRSADVRWSALHQAARAQSAEAVQMLLRFGADPLLRNRNGHTARDLTRNRAVTDLLYRAETQAARGSSPALRSPVRSRSPRASQTQSSARARAKADPFVSRPASPTRVDRKASLNGGGRSPGRRSPGRRSPGRRSPATAGRHVSPAWGVGVSRAASPAGSSRASTQALTSGGRQSSGRRKAWGSPQRLRSVSPHREVRDEYLQTHDRLASRKTQRQQHASRSAKKTDERAREQWLTSRKGEQQRPAAVKTKLQQRGVTDAPERVHPLTSVEQAARERVHPLTSAEQAAREQASIRWCTKGAFAKQGSK